MQIFCVFIQFIFPNLPEENTSDCEAGGFIEIPGGTNTMVATTDNLYFGKTITDLNAFSPEKFDCFSDTWGIEAPDDFLFPFPITLAAIQISIIDYLITNFPTGVEAQPVS